MDYDFPPEVHDSLSRFLDNLIRSAAAAQDDFIDGLPVRAGMALEKPAVWAGEDAPSLAAALMAQRPSTRPRKDVPLEAERLYQRGLIDYLYEKIHAEYPSSLTKSVSERRWLRSVLESWSAASTFSAGGWSTTSRS